MEGNIVYVDYELSSWKYQKDSELSPYAKYITGELPLPENSGIIIKRGYIMPTAKGMGSAYGGKWRPSPNKPKDARYLGKPGEVKITQMDNGETYMTKIGDDGRAKIERHNTDHNRGDKHTNPHDHEISWDNPDEHPMPGPPINYPNGAPEFKQYRRKSTMDDYIFVPAETMAFESISEFKRALMWGAEIEFIWNGVTYDVIRYGTDNKITIYQANRPDTEQVCETADDALEYMLGNDRLRDVITQVRVVARTI